MCTFNGAHYLDDQLDSLLAQSRLPDEILLFDDASTDETYALLERFVPRANNLGVAVVIHRNEKNIGFVRNFSVALERATGDIIFLCDQDDVWYVDKLQKMLAVFEARSDLSLLHTNARLVNATGKALDCSLFEALDLRPEELTKIHAGEAFSVLFKRSAVTGATVALRRDLIERALPVPAEWIHDEWLAMIAAIVGGVDVLEQPLIDYRQHASNQVGMRRRTWRDRVKDVFRPCEPLLKLEIARMDELHKWLMENTFHLRVERLKALEVRQHHFRVRLGLGDRNRVLRWPTICREWVNGNYANFSNGTRSIARDLLRRG